MDRGKVERVLKDLKAGRVGVRAAMESLRGLPYEDLGFAKLDTHRPLRRGFPEAVYCPGKTDAQIVRIVRRLAVNSNVVIATRATAKTYAKVRASLNGTPVAFHDTAKLILIGSPPKRRQGLVLVVTAGTSDIPVADEAAVTAEAMGARVERLTDVGVAGVHRVLNHRAALEKANVIVVVAGMEGALPSVVGGLVERPVIAVPTSVGYGASFDGLAALLAMLNACAPGVAVVNIDNGFGAGYLAAQINRG
ncbi:MAG: nickel pincer cofactor biosynthesis protein LarB [Methanobacteriota archaeon]|nr:MAG: nickel pincer cofactor biosynthesis protein LarB [Euryarchaeota archaeon]